MFYLIFIWALFFSGVLNEVKNTNQKLIFEGNSLMALGSGSSSATSNWNGHYIPINVYSYQKTFHSVNLTMLDSVAKTTKQINNQKYITVGKIANKGDVVILWEITNDLFVNNVSVDSGYSHVKLYCDYVRNIIKAKVIICTMIARDYSTDPSDLWTRGQAINSLIVTNKHSICDTLIDLGSLSIFNSKAGCSNSLYYDTDRLHLTSTARDTIINRMNKVIPIFLN
jgi:hypothetical protein